MHNGVEEVVVPLEEPSVPEVHVPAEFSVMHDQEQSSTPERPKIVPRRNLDVRRTLSFGYNRKRGQLTNEARKISARYPCNLLDD
jgi:hypothetical protein